MQLYADYTCWPKISISAYKQTNCLQSPAAGTNGVAVDRGFYSSKNKLESATQQNT